MDAITAVKIALNTDIIEAGESRCAMNGRTASKTSKSGRCKMAIAKNTKAGNLVHQSIESIRMAIMNRQTADG